MDTTSFYHLPATLAECLDRLKERDTTSEQVPAPPCEVFFSDMKNNGSLDLSIEMCGITQSTILEVLADRPAHEELFMLFACDTILPNKDNVRRLMTIETFDGWFAKKQATQGGLGFFDYANRQPIDSVSVFLFDPKTTHTNDKNKPISPLCSIELVSAERDSSNEEKHEVKETLRYRRTIIKIISNAFIRGSQKGKDILIQSLLASACFIKQTELQKKTLQQYLPIISRNIILELRNYCPDIRHSLLSVASTLKGCSELISKIAMEEAEHIQVIE